MHDVACGLRPGDLSARAQAGGVSQPNLDRASPYGALAEDWEELIGVYFTTAATSTEVHNSHVIAGPFCIKGLVVNLQNANSELSRIAIGVGDSDAASTSLLDIMTNISRESVNDASDTIPSIPWNSNIAQAFVGYVHRGGTGRIVVGHVNTNAATRTVQVLVRIAHLIPACDAHAPHEY